MVVSFWVTECSTLLELIMQHQESIEDLTAVYVSKYIKQLNPNPCQLCNSKQHPTVLVDNSPERKLVFTELKALDAWGTLNFELGTSPIIPLMCRVRA